MKSKIKYKKLRKTKRKHIKKNSTIKNKKYKKMYKGGEGEEEIQKIRDIIPRLSEYSTIYISIGGKYYSSYPSDFKNTGMSQLVPDFIIKESYELKTLIIIIDEFKEEELIENNNVIQNIITNTQTQIDYIIINHYFDEEIKIEIDNLIDRLTTQNIYIVDYVYFFYTANKREEIILITIKELLNQLLTKMIHKYGTSELPKNKNIYKWLGKIDPDYILEFNKYEIFSPRISEALRNLKSAKKPLSTNMINQLKYLKDKIDKYCLKITSDYDETFLSTLSSL
jgi:hypothetical protein